MAELLGLCWKQLIARDVAGEFKTSTGQGVRRLPLIYVRGLRKPSGCVGCFGQKQLLQL